MQSAQVRGAAKLTEISQSLVSLIKAKRLTGEEIPVMVGIGISDNMCRRIRAGQPIRRPWPID
jgi:hypothetical protein